MTKPTSRRRKPSATSKKMPHARTKMPTHHNQQQVRIIGGRFKRRQLTFHNVQGLRPTPDRLRETLFNWLMPYLFEATVLDACAGSGVLGFEALSRGASHVTFIEADNKQAKVLQETATSLRLEGHEYTIIYAQAEKVISSLPTTLFNIVFIDPPYALQLCPLIIEQLLENELINADTLLYIEDNQPLETTLQQLPYSYDLLKTVTMGQVNGSLIHLKSPRA